MTPVAGALVLARMSSTRLPGKVMREVGGKPLLGHVLSRLERAECLDRVIVATSTETDDDPIVKWCQQHAQESGRGPRDNVLRRVVEVAQDCCLDVVVRVNADSPWPDPELIDLAVRTLNEGGSDLVSNIQERSWPYGVAAEAMTLEALERLLADTSDPTLTEHVTAAFYRRPETFRITNLRARGKQARPDVVLTVDDELQLRRFEELVERLGPRTTNVSTSELVELTDRLKRTGE